jgi:hypothetical protein
VLHISRLHHVLVCLVYRTKVAMVLLSKDHIQHLTIKCKEEHNNLHLISLGLLDDICHCTLASLLGPYYFNFYHLLKIMLNL